MKNNLLLVATLLFFFICPSVSAQNAPTFTISVNGNEVNSVCLGIAPTFKATSSSNSFSWDFGDGKSGTGSSISNQYTQAGSYIVTLKDNETGLSTPKTIVVNPVPKSSFSLSSNSSCTGTPITFTSTSTSISPIVLYQWDFGNGNGASKSNPSTDFSYNSAGTFTPSLIVQDQNGCTGTSINNPQIQIGGSDVQASFQANGNLFYSCDNSIAFVNNSNENGKSGVSYTWDFGDNSTSNSKNPGTHTYGGPGVYKVSLKASYGGNAGCAPGFTQTVYIGKPTISINAPNEICANALFNLSATSNINGFVESISDLTWQLDNGNVLNGGASGYFNNVPGSNLVRVTNVKGCPNQATKLVNVLAAPQVNLSLIPSFGACTETIVSFTTTTSSSNTTPVQSYNWTAGDGTPPTGNVPSSAYIHQYDVAGNYTASVSATSTSGCTSTTQVPVSIINDCTDYGFGTAYNPVFSFTSLGCNNKYTITIKNKNGLNPVKEWIVDGIVYPAVNDEATVSLPPPNPGEKNKKYTVRTVFKNGTFADTKNIGIIDEEANFTFINTDNGSKFCASNRFVFYTDTSINLQNVSQLIWKIVNIGTQESYNISGNSPSFVFPKPGEYSVELTVYDVRPTPCISTITKNIKVDGMAIDFTADSTVFCYANPTMNLKVHINNSANIQSIYWETGDGTRFNSLASATDTTLVYQYNYTGNNNQNFYRVYFAALDADGCLTSLGKDDFIKIFVPKVSFYKTDTILCSTKKILIQNTSNVPNGDYLWKVGNFTKTYQNRSEFNHTFDSIPNPSTMDVYLKVTDAGGCTKDTLIENYIRFAKPTAKFDIVNKNLLNECPSYTLILKNASNNFTSANWVITDRAVSSYSILDSLYYTVRHPGKTSINLNISLDGCSDTIIDTFTVKGPVATLKILDSVGCTPYNSRMVISHNDDVNGYQWDFGDGNTIVSANADSIVHTYRTAGTYTPKVSVSGYEGCTDSLDVLTTITAAHLSPTMQAFNVLDKCSLDTPKFLNTTQIIAIPIQKYIWNWGNVLKEENNSKDTIARLFPDTSMYVPVSLTAVTDFCTATSDTVIVSPHFTNKISIVGDSAFCDNVSLSLKGVATNTPDANNIYTWYTQKDSVLYSGKDSTLTMPMDSSLMNLVKLKLTNTFGCTNTTTQNIKLLKSPTILLDDSLKLCRADSITLHGSADGNFLWNSTSSQILDPTSSNPTIYPSESTYFYTTVTNNDNCQAKDSIWVQVDARIGTSYQDNYKSCLSDTLGTTIQVNTQIPSHFTWSSLPLDGSITDSTGPIITVNPRVMTTYHFVAHSQNVCPDETGDILLQYAPSPVINFVNKVITEPAGTFFTLAPNIENLTPGTRFTWTPDTRLDNRYAQNPTVIADKDITYTLALLDQYGCTTSDSVSIKVLCNTSKILMANAFTPNEDGKNDRFYVTGYGIRNVVHFYVIDRWGKKIFERNNIAANDISQGWDGTINGKPCEAGTYMYMGEVECTEGNKIPIKGSVVLIR
ncbi:MAG: hypothetical protein DI598_04025 [Pseudopedobacter saltans]|uniref:PKD domain-containing protein n=1 Tax=Pseudopedobacter saltans TaxID=151895 RepID=A0A2W5F4S0_9SPHI|nr:MAG: hypothetical protein DI598_04025 [Pseudopedobacter saltans]